MLKRNLKKGGFLEKVLSQYKRSPETFNALVDYFLDNPKTPYPTYLIIEKNGQKGIKCTNCNLTSFNPNDIKHKYCGKCNKYHQQLTNF